MNFWTNELLNDVGTIAALFPDAAFLSEVYHLENSEVKVK